MASNDERAEDDTQEGSAEPRPRTAEDVIREQQAAGDQPAAGDQAAPPWASQPDTPQAQRWQQPQGQQGQEPWQQPPPGQQWQQPPPGQQWQQSPPGQQWQQPPPGWTAQQGWGGYAQQPAYGSSVMVIIAAVFLIIIGALITIVGLFGVLVGGFLEEAIGGIQDPTIPLEGLGQVITVIFGILLVVGVLHIISSIGIFLHRSWGRIIGILLAVLGTLLWVLGVAGAMQAPAAQEAGREAVLPILLAVGYGFSLFALIAGGHHFRRRWR